MTHKCVNKLTIIGSYNGLSPDRRQAIIWTNAGILLIGPLGTNFSEIFIGINKFSFKKMLSKMSSGKCRPFCPGLNVLTPCWFSWSLGSLLLIQINPLRAIFFRVNINMYLHFMSFLRTNKTGSWNSFSSKTRTCLYYIINIMAADVLATQGARASATMILT